MGMKVPIQMCHKSCQCVSCWIYNSRTTWMLRRFQRKSNHNAYESFACVDCLLKKEKEVFRICWYNRNKMHCLFCLWNSIACIPYLGYTRTSSFISSSLYNSVKAIAAGNTGKIMLTWVFHKFCRAPICLVVLPSQVKAVVSSAFCLTFCLLL